MSAPADTSAGTAPVRDGFDASSLRRAFEDLEGSRVVLHAKVYLDEALIRRLTDALSSVAGRQIHIDVKVNPTMDSGATLQIGEDHRVVLDPRSKWVSGIQRSVGELVETGELPTPEDTYAYLRNVLTTTDPEVTVEELLDTGSVVEVGDGIATVSGLRDVGSQELVEFAGGVFGIAFSLLGDRVGCILL